MTARRTRYRVAVPVCCFFAANPEESLTAKDILAKFEGLFSSNNANVWTSLQGLVAEGWLACARRDQDRRSNVYRAGPKLLAMLGEGTP